MRQESRSGITVRSIVFASQLMRESLGRTRCCVVWVKPVAMTAQVDREGYEQPCFGNPDCLIVDHR